ncbi:MAG: hypothetical protein V1696_00275 [Candidatus Jorgensenbacteria bacterium]
MVNFITGLLGAAAAAVVLGPTLMVAGVIGWIAMTLSGLLLSLGGLIAGAANYIQTFIVSDQNAIVTVGWTIVRDIANLGFVIVIIVIAFATILRIESYGAKKLLPRLIMAAILVNFSLQIGASIIGFSQVITDFFFTKISLSPGEIGSTLLGAFGPQRFLAGAKDPGSALAAGASITINLVMGPWLATAFNLIMLFTILVLAFMLIIRFLSLSFLLVIAPITWLFFVIPALQGQFSKWWNKFLQWTFFAPATSFFVYLSFIAAQGLGELWKGAGSATISGVDSIIQSIFIDGVNVILLSGFLIGGLIVAQNMSITGAKGAMSIANKVGGGVKKGFAAYAGQQALRGGAAAAGSRWGRQISGGLQGVGNRLQGVGAGGGRIARYFTAPIRNAGARLSGAGARTQTFGATAPRPAANLLNSVMKGVRGAFGLKQWQCNECGTVVGPSKKPPDKCPSVPNAVGVGGCPTNAPGGPKISWKGL